MTSSFWKDIWDSKGLSESTDLLYLDGYEHLNIDFNSRDICKKIVSLMDITQGDSILEVACGAGFLAQNLQEFGYVGVDYSRSIIQKHKDIFPSHNVLVAEADKLPFGDNSFDNVFCFGLFQYLPDVTYAQNVITEMKRVSKKIIFLGDLKSTKTRKEHFVFPKQELARQNFIFSQCLYDAKDAERYNAQYRI